MPKYNIDFIWFDGEESYEETITLPAEDYADAVRKIKSMYGDKTYVEYYERIVE